MNFVHWDNERSFPKFRCEDINCPKPSSVKNKTADRGNRTRVEVKRKWVSAGGEEARWDNPTCQVFVWTRVAAVEQRIMGLQPVSMVMWTSAVIAKLVRHLAGRKLSLAPACIPTHTSFRVLDHSSGKVLQLHYFFILSIFLSLGYSWLFDPLPSLFPGVRLLPLCFFFSMSSLIHQSTWIFRKRKMFEIQVKTPWNHVQTVRRTQPWLWWVLQTLDVK